MKRSYRRLRNTQNPELNTERPFFSKSHEKSHEDQHFFSSSKVQKKDLDIGKPGDKYEKEADAMADAVVNHSQTPDINKKEISAIQKESLATPQEDEKLGTAEQRMEEDKRVQTKSEESMSEEEKEMPVQEKSDEGTSDLEEENEAVPVQTKRDASAAPVSQSITKQLNRKSGKGKPLPSNTKKEMGKAFGVDFSQVNVHTDADSVEMNRILHAQAFTHGKDIYFNVGKYNPESASGKHLLTHELTHVVQQSKNQRSIQRITCNDRSGISAATAPQGQRNPLDDRARRIMDIASNPDSSNEQKAQRLITAIVCHYYNPDASKIRNIIYQPALIGLQVDRIGRGDATRGDINVGDYFIQNTNPRNFARRVLQVGHEIEHINQYRRGMVGRRYRDEREFLAFYQGAFDIEFVGTGRISASNRLSLIHAALGYYYCMTLPKQEEHRQKKQNLLDGRSRMATRRGISLEPAPTTCVRSE